MEEKDGEADDEDDDDDKNQNNIQAATKVINKTDDDKTTHENQTIRNDRHISDNKTITGDSKTTINESKNIIVNEDHTYSERPSCQSPTPCRKNRQRRTSPPYITVKWYSPSPLRCCFSRKIHRNRRKNILCIPRTPVYHLHFHNFP